MALTIEKVKEIAMKHYNHGGDAIIECCEDADIQAMIDRGMTEKELLESFEVREEYFRAAKYFSGYDEELEEEEKEEREEELDEYDEDENDYYTPSSSNRDYSPSNPWDAPGMSIRDFI